MKRKYKISIIVIALLLALSFTLSTSYGIYKAVNKDKGYVSQTLDCIEMISESEFITSESLPILSDTDVNTLLPYTVSFTNICNQTKDIELRLNILENSTVNYQDLKIGINGDLEIKPTIYSSLINSSSNKKNNLSSKIIGNISLQPQETKRINLRLWIDSTRNSQSQQSIQAIIEYSSNKTIIKPIFKDVILTNNSNIISKELIDFSRPETANAIIAKTFDSEGETYYFRGPVLNNYVYFANMMWRIVRINGDGSVRLIYDDTPLENTQYNEAASRNFYLGYTYKIENEESSSKVAQFLEQWYETNLKKYEDYITNSQFCNDTKFEEVYGIEYYESYKRLTNNVNPTLKCSDNEYTERIGLITADELAFAGATKNTINTSFYLHTGYSFYTMSPSRFSYSTGYMMILNSYGSIKDLAINQASGIRPVISLESIVSVTGSGTKENPYRIDPLEA